MKRIIALIAILIIVGFIISKCTSGNHDSKVFSIARDPKFEPLALYGKQTSVVAFSDELVASIAAKEHMSIEILSVLSSHLFRGLDNDEYHGILTSLTPPPHTINNYLISDPYLLLGPVAIVQADSSIDSIIALNTKTIGILKNNPVVFDVEQYPKVSITSFGTPTDAIESLIKNRVDAVLMDVLQAYAFTKLYQDQIKIATAPISKKGLRLVTKRNARGQELIDIFNKGLQDVKNDGIYDDLLVRWDLFDPEILSAENLEIKGDEPD